MSLARVGLTALRFCVRFRFLSLLDLSSLLRLLPIDMVIPSPHVREERQYHQCRHEVGSERIGSAVSMIAMPLSMLDHASQFRRLLQVPLLSETRSASYWLPVPSTSYARVPWLDRALRKHRSGFRIDSRQKDLILHSGQHRLAAVLLKFPFDLRQILKSQEVRCVPKSADFEFVL